MVNGEEVLRHRPIADMIIIKVAIMVTNFAHLLHNDLPKITLHNMCMKITFNGAEFFKGDNLSFCQKICKENSSYNLGLREFS